MDIQAALRSQYHAALKTLREVIEKCPDGLWNDGADSAAPFWRVVYHTLFFTHLYLQRTSRLFAPGPGTVTKRNSSAPCPGRAVHPGLASLTRARNF
jgi:hypothetical protein